MADPITTMTASAIATLAFQEFVKSGAGEMAKKFTAEAIVKMGQLRELVWNRLTGKHTIAEEALAKANAGEQEGIDMVATLLNAEMLDKVFAEQVRAIVESIQKEALDGTSSTQIHQTVSGNQNQVIGQVTGGKVFGNVTGNVNITE
jgi:uridylate kinase